MLTPADRLTVREAPHVTPCTAKPSTTTTPRDHGTEVWAGGLCRWIWPNRDVSLGIMNVENIWPALVFAVVIFGAYAIFALGWSVGRVAGIGLAGVLAPPVR